MGPVGCRAGALGVYKSLQEKHPLLILLT